MRFAKVRLLAFMLFAGLGAVVATPMAMARAAPVALSSPINDEAVLLSILAGAGDHGLARPGDVEFAARLATASPDAAPALRQALEMRLRAYAAALSGRRLDPARISRDWAQTPTPRDLAGEFDRARLDGRLATWFAALPPDDVRYRALTAERRRYAGIAGAGGWPTLAPGPSLSPEARDPRVAALRARLAAEGYVLADSAEPEVFDADLATALALFQIRHGLTADSVLGPATLEALNRPAESVLARIDANLERWRWVGTPPADRVEVDIAEPEATLFQAGQATLVQRAIVGAPRTRTPLFSDQIETVVFNPPWNVPAKIAIGELLPKAARDPGYLKRNRISIVGGRLVQAPGPGNSLGRIKFDLPNPFGVYLHDTSSPGLFVRSRRTLSHGCMRMEKPRELAVLLLGGTWDRAAVDAAIDAGETLRVPLPRPIAVFTAYRTVAVGEDGIAVFRPDVYGWDDELIVAINRLN